MPRILTKMRKPSQGAAHTSAHFLESGDTARYGTKHLRIQVLTIEELIGSRAIDSHGTNLLLGFVDGANRAEPAFWTKTEF